MRGLSSKELEAVERASAEPMLDQVLNWAAVNSGSRNLGGLERMAELLADAFAALPGVLRLENPEPVDAVEADGRNSKAKAWAAPSFDRAADRASATALHRAYGHGIRRRPRLPANALAR